MAVIITPVSYQKLLTTITKPNLVPKPGSYRGGNLQRPKMRQLVRVGVSENTVRNSFDDPGISTHLLDLLDEDILLNLAYEFGLHETLELPELVDIDKLIETEIHQSKNEDKLHSQTNDSVVKDSGSGVSR